MTDATAHYPRSHRLLAAGHYQRVFKSCKTKASSRFFTVLAVSNGLSHARLGTIVAKKNAGNAVKRNRIKRLIKESFRLNQRDLAGWDLVVLARAGVSAADNRQLLHTLQSHWRTIAAHAHTAPTTN